MVPYSERASPRMGFHLPVRLNLLSVGASSFYSNTVVQVWKPLSATIFVSEGKQVDWVHLILCTRVPMTIYCIGGTTADMQGTPRPCHCVCLRSTISNRSRELHHQVTTTHVIGSPSVATTYKSVVQQQQKSRLGSRHLYRCVLFLSVALTRAKIESFPPLFLDRACLCAPQNMSENAAMLPSPLSLVHVRVRAMMVAPRSARG